MFVCVCEKLTRPALVLHTEVFADGRAGVRPKQTTVDKNLTSPPVLTFIQHLLQTNRQTQRHRQLFEWHVFIQVNTFHAFHFPHRRFLPSGHKNTQSVILLQHTVLYMCVFIACGFTKCATVNHACMCCHRCGSSNQLLPRRNTFKCTKTKYSLIMI